MKTQGKIALNRLKQYHKTMQVQSLLQSHGKSKPPCNTLHSRTSSICPRTDNLLAALVISRSFHLSVVQDTVFRQGDWLLQ